MRLLLTAVVEPEAAAVRLQAVTSEAAEVGREIDLARPGLGLDQLLPHASIPHMQVMLGHDVLELVAGEGIQSPSGLGRH